MIVTIGARDTMNKWIVSAPFQSIDPSHAIPHKGIDFAIAEGTKVPSIGEGVVTAITDEGNTSFGKAVHVHMKDGADVIYGHLSEFKVRIGQTVHENDTIGLSGTTGDSTGPHLHLQVMQNHHVIDPNIYMKQLQTVSEAPWWAKDAITWFEHYLQVKFYAICDSITQGLISLLDILFPTVACLSIIWWMFSFLPKSDKAPRVLGATLVSYMFYVLIRS